MGKVEGSAMYQKWYYEVTLDHIEQASHMMPHLRIGWANSIGYTHFFLYIHRKFKQSVVNCASCLVWGICSTWWFGWKHKIIDLCKLWTFQILSLSRRWWKMGRQRRGRWFVFLRIWWRLLVDWYEALILWVFFLEWRIICFIIKSI